MSIQFQMRLVTALHHRLVLHQQETEKNYLSSYQVSHDQNSIESEQYRNKYVTFYKDQLGTESIDESFCYPKGLKTCPIKSFPEVII